MPPLASSNRTRGGRTTPAPHIAPRRRTVTPRDPLHPVSLYLEDLAAFPRPGPDRPVPTTDPGTEPGTALVEGNLRLVVSVARTYAPLLRDSKISLDLADLIQEGNLGLMEAARHYDPRRGYQFSTYAVWWIRQAIVRAIRGADTIRLPDYVQTRLHTLSSEGTEEARSASASSGVQAVPRTVSLEALTREERRQVMDLCDATARDPAEAVCALHEAEERQRWLEEAIHRLLPPRQRAVMEALLDRGDRWHPATLVEVARKLRLHPERVRQLREDALARLRAAWQAHCQHKTRPQETPEKGVITHDTAIFLG